jgi:hypothetical protein
MGGHHRNFIACFVRILVVLLIIGTVVNLNGRRGRSAYWQGFRDGAQTVVGATDAETPGIGAPDGPGGFAGPHGPAGAHGFAGPRGFGGLGLGEFFLTALCGVALLGFFGLLFTMARFAGRHGPRGKWGGPPHTKAVDEDEIGPEKDPNDYL